MTTDGRAGLVGALALLVVITVATNTASSLAQPQIGAEFGVGPADTGWVVFGYSASFAVGTALYGGIAGRIGLVPALISGVLALAIGSAVAAAAPSMELLIGSRLVQGLGSGAIPTLSVALLARDFAGADRARVLGVVVAAVGAGQAIGPLLGGLLLEVLGWRAAVSLGIVAAPALLVLWRSQRGRMEQPTGARLDLIGAGLVAVVALGTAFVLNRAPLLGLVPITVVPMVAVLASVFALWRRARARPDAFLPRSVVASPVFRRVTVLGVLGMAAFIGTVVLIPPVASRAYGLGGLGLGLVMLPMAITAAVTSPNNARVEARWGRRGTATLSLLALGLGCMTLAVGALTVGLPAVLVALAAIGFGFGLLTAPLLNELTHAFSESERPVAVGVYNLCFFLGGGLGAAVSSALVQIGAELPFIGPNAVPGFATAELLLAVGPVSAAGFGWLGGRNPRTAIHRNAATAESGSGGRHVSVASIATALPPLTFVRGSVGHSGWQKAAGTSPAGIGPMSIERNKALVRRFIDEVFVQGREDAVDELVSPDFVPHSWPGVGPGAEPLKQAQKRISAGLSDVSMRIEDMIAEGDRVAVRLSSHAVHSGEFMGMPASGRDYTISETHIFRIRDGKVAEHWRDMDSMDLMRQLGVMPEPARAHATDTG